MARSNKLTVSTAFNAPVEDCGFLLRASPARVVPPASGFDGCVEGLEKN